MAELDIASVRELEDLVIYAVYADFLKARLNQKEEQILIDFSTKPQRPNVAQLQQSLAQWREDCEKALTHLDSIADKVTQKEKAASEAQSAFENELARVTKGDKGAMDVDSPHSEGKKKRK